MSILAWVLFGFLAGALARLVTPGKHPRGCITTIAIGIAGAVLGGLAGSVLFDRRVEYHFGLGPFLLAVLGSVILLLFLQALRDRR
ncbi:MAG: GlsB/YeaQ/YmgE family stress response membrane protein [Gaiellaceae bacterium]